MKYTIYRLLIISFLIFLIHSCIDIRNYYSPIRLNKNLYIDKTEVDVSSWLSYYTWILEHEGIDAAEKIFPDSIAVDSKVWKYIKHSCINYNNHTGYYSMQRVGYFCDNCKDLLDSNIYRSTKIDYCPILYYPITGLTYEQVNKFCEWRTRHSDNGLIYRLPSIEEWRTLALKGLTVNERKNGIGDSVIREKCKKFNYKVSKYCNCYDSIVEVREIGSYIKDLQGLYDIFGNVSEMTNIKGISKGGNYLLNAKQCNIDSIQRYYKPEQWLGFRCVAEKK